MSLLETLLALGVTLVVTGAMLGAFDSAHRTVAVHSQTVEMHQRARVVFARLREELMNARATPDGLSGVGVALRPDVLSPLTASWARDNRGAITIVQLRAFDPLVVTTRPFHATDDSVTVQAGPSCPRLRMPCGLVSDSLAMIFDDRGHSEIVRLTRVGDDVVEVEAPGNQRRASFSAGASLIPLDVRSYYFDAERAQVRYRDGWVTDVPVIDDVVDLVFTYFGPPLEPPTQSTSGPGPCGPAGVPAVHPLLPDVPIDPATFSDGPWCGGYPLFDTDAFRVHRVRVQLRLQAATAQHRGRNERLFARPGFATDWAAAVPDATFQFDVALRNARPRQIGATSPPEGT